MKIANKLKQRSGFTLVELCVVMAIAAIVGTMVVSFMMFASGQQAQITDEAKRIEETAKVQAEVNAWLKQYDSENYTLTSPGNNRIIATTATGTQAGVLSFGDGKITVDGTPVTEELKNIQAIGFYRPDRINAGGETVSEQVVKVTVTYGNADAQTLLFPLFSDLVRTRKVEGR